MRRMDKDFAIVIRDALLMIIRYLEKRFGLGKKEQDSQITE